MHNILFGWYLVLVLAHTQVCLPFLYGTGWGTPLDVSTRVVGLQYANPDNESFFGEFWKSSK